jgi:hypothetical protein
MATKKKDRKITFEVTIQGNDIDIKSSADAGVTPLEVLATLELLKQHVMNTRFNNNQKQQI